MPLWRRRFATDCSSSAATPRSPPRGTRRRDLNATDNILSTSRFFEQAIPPVAKKFPNLMSERPIRRRSCREPDPDADGDDPVGTLRRRRVHRRDGRLGRGVDLFASDPPQAAAFPVASTEGRGLLWTNWNPSLPPNASAALKTRLDQDLQYRILFRDVLG